jgi:AcrR family transcriptional regulator
MSSPPPSLSARHADLTQRVILDAAVELLTTAPVNELSVRAVAKHAGMSERTIFRYFATRDDLLDGVANEIAHRSHTSLTPTSVEELLEYPAAIYAHFEANAALIRAALHSELYHRIRNVAVQHRGAAVRALVDRVAPARSEQERRLAAANILYYVVATTWHYYRFYFGFSLEDSVQCARMAIAQALEGLGAPGRAARRRAQRP